MAKNYTNANADRYQGLSRKVFDKHVDRMALQRSRDREDRINDLQILIQRINELQDRLQHLEEHVAQHCLTMTAEDGEPGHGGSSTEGLE